MKKLICIICLHLSLINLLSAQCTVPDASIWKDTWASCDQTPNPIAEYGNSHWIQYNFGSIRNLSKTWVWNTNDPTKLDQGFNLVKIDYSEDGKTWITLGEMNFPKAKGEAVYSGFSGPDFSNLKAQYVLLTAISNHGNPSCAGLAEIKFNLLPEAGTAIPSTNNDDPDDNVEDICSLIEAVDLSEFVEVETAATEAFLYLEVEEEIAALPLIFEYRSVDGDWESAEIEDDEIFMENLIPGTTYEYRITLDCGEAMNSTPISTFQTIACVSIQDIVIEELTETEAFFLWQTVENQEVYFIEIKQAGEEEIWDIEVEEAEFFLDELDPNTTYEIRIGTECGEDILWKEWIQFTTISDLDLSTSVSSRINLAASQVHLFPNPTPGQLTVRIKTPKKDVLNYAISDMQGRILFRNTTKLHSGTNDLTLDLSLLTDGTYWINGVTINQRAQVNEQIVKVSK